MSKGAKNTKPNKNNESNKSKDKIKASGIKITNTDYLVSMSHAPGIQESSHWLQMLPAVFFTAVVIVITRMTSYERDMSEFFWSVDKTQLTDFFSYYKMMAILICALFAIVFLLYRIFIQSFYIKRSYAYIPMIVYSVFVLLSYLFSDYKLFALWGFNDRFEGTLVLLAYMVMLFYIINTVNSERNVKQIIYSLAVVSCLLGLLGVTQASNHDFFRTAIGKKLITPTWFWDQVDNLNFTFTDQIYQTVYNINYVSFYLTLLIPIFGLLFIRAVNLGKKEPLYRKVIWGALFSLLIYNLIGSSSSGGLMGMGIVVLVALIVLNRTIVRWWKPALILVAITVLVGAFNVQRWLPELSTSMDGFKDNVAMMQKDESKHKIDYLETKGDSIILGYEGDTIVFQTYSDDPSSVSIMDSTGSHFDVEPVAGETSVFRIQDERYSWITVKPGKDDENHHYIVIATDGFEWPFRLTKDGPKYYTGLHALVDLRKVPAIGWENNQSFGSGRGYIWSRTIPMMKETLLLGHGADTYCIYFPHDDYVGKYNTTSYAHNINIIVDKPHNLYFGYMIGTGFISVLALLALWLAYIVQSFRLYWRFNSSSSFLSIAGLGIFLGICGFLAAAFVNDSSVSVTPMFYGLLGTGIAANMILKRDIEI